MSEIQQNSDELIDTSIKYGNLLGNEMTGVIQEIMKEAEFNSKPKLDKRGNITVGFGRKLNISPLTKEEGLILLQGDIELLSRLVCRLPYYAELSPTQRGVILTLVYEIGLQEYKKLKKLESALSEKNYSLAAKEFLDVEWSYQNRQRALNLAKKLKKV